MRDEFERKIREREWPIEMLMKTDTLQDSLEKYRQKIAGSARNRAAAYELALASGRDYRPGEQISYYVKTTPKKVPAYEAAKLASEFDPQNRDENIDYYVGKLAELMKKFGGIAADASSAKQQDLALVSQCQALFLAADKLVSTQAPQTAWDHRMRVQCDQNCSRAINGVSAALR